MNNQYERREPCEQCEANKVNKPSRLTAALQLIRDLILYFMLFTAGTIYAYIRGGL